MSDLTCPCGATLGGDPSARICRECRDDLRAVGAAMRDERIAEMWAAGLTQQQIADVLGSTRGGINTAMARMRQKGWDLPRRHNWTPEGLAVVAEVGRRSRP